MGYVVDDYGQVYVLTVLDVLARRKSCREFTSTSPQMLPLMQLEPISLSMVVTRRLRTGGLHSGQRFNKMY